MRPANPELLPDRYWQIATSDTGTGDPHYFDWITKSPPRCTISNEFAQICVSRALLLSGWIIAPAHHPGYHWEAFEDLREGILEWCYRTAPLVRMRPNWDHFPSWEMEHPEVQSHEHNLVREIMANCHVIHDKGGVFEIPGPAPAVRA